MTHYIESTFEFGKHFISIRFSSLENSKIVEEIIQQLKHP